MTPLATPPRREGREVFSLACGLPQHLYKQRSGETQRTPRGVGGHLLPPEQAPGPGGSFKAGGGY